MSKHTPGPWVADFAEVGYAGVPIYRNGDAVLLVAVVNDENADAAVVRADANLIAAAPDLYDAAVLEEAASNHWADCRLCGSIDREGFYVTSCGVHANLQRDAEIARQAAIAKAEGK